MDNKFLYVFSKEDRDALIEEGLSLLKEDADNAVFIFKADECKDNERINFAYRNIGHCVLSDILTF